MVSDFGEVTIREATAQDAGAVARVHLASWKQANAGIVPDGDLAAQDPAEREERWRRTLTSGDSTTWIADTGGHVIGFATLGACRDEDAEQGDLELYAIYLDPEAWGRGAARELIRRALAEVPAGSPVSLWVLASNDRAQRFYRRHGFVADGVERLEDQHGGDLVEVRYRREASPAK